MLDDDSSQSVSASYAWHVVDAATGTDTEVQSGSSTTLSGAQFFDKNDQVYVVVTPNDGVADGATATSTSLTIANTDPVLATVTLSYSGNLTSTSLLTCEHTASDTDGDGLTPSYVWTNMTTGAAFASTASTLQLTAATASPGDTVECAVTVTDDSNGSDTMSVTDTVSNTGPTFSSAATISTAGSQVGTRRTCSAVGRPR